MAGGRALVFVACHLTSVHAHLHEIIRMLCDGQDAPVLHVGHVLLAELPLHNDRPPVGQPVPTVGHKLVVIVRNDDELMSDGWDWLANRWAIVVERELGQEHVPDMEHGCVLTVAEHADYLVQMGMDAREVAGDKDKRAAAGHRTPWRIAQDASSSRGTELDRRLWLDYTRATHGRRQLVWSRGLRAASGARHTSDLAILDAAVARADSVILVRLSAEEWKRALARCVVCALLTAAETGDVRAVARLELAVREAPS